MSLPLSLSLCPILVRRDRRSLDSKRCSLFLTKTHAFLLLCRQPPGAPPGRVLVGRRHVHQLLGLARRRHRDRDDGADHALHRGCVLVSFSLSFSLCVGVGVCAHTDTRTHSLSHSPKKYRPQVRGPRLDLPRHRRLCQEEPARRRRHRRQGSGTCVRESAAHVCVLYVSFSPPSFSLSLSHTHTAQAAAPAAVEEAEIAPQGEAQRSRIRGAAA